MSIIQFMYPINMRFWTYLSLFIQCFASVCSKDFLCKKLPFIEVRVDNSSRMLD